jgi:hypothetical protein
MMMQACWLGVAREAVHGFLSSLFVLSWKESRSGNRGRHVCFRFKGDGGQMVMAAASGTGRRASFINCYFALCPFFINRTLAVLL